MGSENGVDQSGFPQSRLAWSGSLEELVAMRGGREHTNTDDIELEASLEQLLLNLLGDAVETNVASREDSIPLGHCHGHLERTQMQRTREGLRSATNEGVGRRIGVRC